MGDTDTSGFEGRLYLQSLQSVPVYPAEKRMLPQLCLRILSSTQTLNRVLGEELGEKQMEKERKTEMMELRLLSNLSHSFWR